MKLWIQFDIYLKATFMIQDRVNLGIWCWEEEARGYQAKACQGPQSKERWDEGDQPHRELPWNHQPRARSSNKSFRLKAILDAPAEFS